MVMQQLSGILDIANVFISFFVLIYAWSFLRQTQDVRDRRPWVFLFIATAIFFIFEVIGALNVFNISQMPGLGSFLETVFIALILFVFIFQYDLILKSDLILITRKLAQEEEDVEQEVAGLEKEIKTVEKTTTVKKKSKKKQSSKRAAPKKKAVKKQTAKKRK